MEMYNYQNYSLIGKRERAEFDDFNSANIGFFVAQSLFVLKALMVIYLSLELNEGQSQKLTIFRKDLHRRHILCE